jgi:hypothetical protein
LVPEFTPDFNALPFVHVVGFIGPSEFASNAWIFLNSTEKPVGVRSDFLLPGILESRWRPQSDA